MNNKVIAKRLKACRKERGLTQVQLASYLNCAVSVIGGAETNRGISKQLAIKLSNFFNKPLDFFLLNDDTNFVKYYETLETTKLCAERLIETNIINSNNVNNLSNDIMDLLKNALQFDLSIMIKKVKEK